MLTSFDQIPIDFTLSTLTEHKRKTIQIKYYIKQAVDAWKSKASHTIEDTRTQLYEDLSEILPLGFHSIEKFAKKL